MFLFAGRYRQFFLQPNFNKVLQFLWFCWITFFPRISMILQALLGLESNFLGQVEKLSVHFSDLSKHV